MPWNQYLILLLGGYWLLHRGHRFRFRADRLSGQKLLIEAAIAGVLAGLVAFSATRALLATPQGRVLGDAWKQVLSFHLSGTLVLGLAFLLAAPYVFNARYPLEAAKELALRQLGTWLEHILFRSARDGDLVGLEMTNGEYFIGWAVETPKLHPREAFFLLLPILVGHKDASAPEPTFTKFVNYTAAVEESDDAMNHRASRLNIDNDLIQDLAVMLRLDDVRSATLVDPNDAHWIAEDLIASLSSAAEAASK